MAVKALKLELVINDIAIKLSASGANVFYSTWRIIIQRLMQQKRL